MLEVVLLVGLPGAGKTTFHRARFAETHAHVSRDLFPNNRQPARRQQQLIEEALVAGRSLVVDNASVTLEERALIISAARTRGARVVGYWFPVDVPRSLARNELRTGKSRVPKVAIFAARKRLVAPSHAEGFDALFEVDARDGQFVVRELSRRS